MSCNYCVGDGALFYKDEDNCAFVDSKGKMLVCVNGESIEFQVKYCPACGRELVFQNDKNIETKPLCKYSIDGKCTNDNVAADSCSATEIQIESCLPYQRSVISTGENWRK